MNKNVIFIYNDVLSRVLDEFGITEQLLFDSNNEECVNARKALVMGCVKMGLTDNEIAVCTKRMRRCSVCKVRNKFDDRTAPWTVRMCIEHIKRNV